MSRVKAWSERGRSSGTAGCFEGAPRPKLIAVGRPSARYWPRASPIKITNLFKIPDVTFKRGLIASLDLYQWLNEVRNGSQEQLKTVNIKLMSEDHSTIAQEWNLANARPIKYTGPTLKGTDTEVAVDELTICCENLTVV